MKTKSILASILSVCATGVVFAVGPMDYAKKLTLTVNPSVLNYATASVEDVPVAVRLSEEIDGFSYSYAGDDGSQLYFCDGSGNRIPHDIENWNVDGESVVWVRMPKFGPGERMYLYCKGPANTDNNPYDVWAGFTGVWHMNEAEGSVADATGHALSAEPKGEAPELSVATPGPVANARINADNYKYNYLDVQYSELMDLGDKLTFSGWVKSSMLWGAGRMTLVMHAEVLWGDGWSVHISPDSSTELCFWGSSNAHNESLVSRNVPDMTKDWVHITVVYSGYNGYLYVNGKKWTTLQNGDFGVTSWIKEVRNNKYPLSFGYTSNGHNDDGWSRPLQGAFDEYRLSGDVKDANRIAAEYAAQLPGVLSFKVEDVGDVIFATDEIRNFRKSFTISAGDIGTDDTLNDFVMLVRISPEQISGFSYTDFIQGDLSDIAFFDADGKRLSFDVDTWNVGGESLVWVKVPHFSKDTVITCAYGSLYRNDIHQPSTWSKYRGVWHLNENGDGVRAIGDATANDLSGSSHANTRFNASGKLGGAREIANSRTNKGNIVIPYKDALNMNESRTNLVISTWFYTNDGGCWGGVLFSRINGFLDPGWAMSFGVGEMNNLDYYYRGNFDGMSIPWNGGNGGYYRTFAEEEGYVGARSDNMAGSWHKVTINYEYDGSKVIARSYVDGQDKGARWLYHFPEGAERVESNRSYNPLYQSVDRGLSFGGMIQDCNWSLNGSMDEIRLSNAGVNATVERMEFNQESGSLQYVYSQATNVEGSVAPTVTSLSKAIELVQGGNEYTYTVNGAIAKLDGESAVVHFVVGYLGEGDYEAVPMRRVDSKVVTAAGPVSFDLQARYGAKTVCRLEVDNVMDATHTIVDSTETKSLFLDELSTQYIWNSTVADGDWENPDNWSLYGTDDGLPHLGYPSYTSRIRVGGNTTAKIRMHAYYGSIATAFIDNKNINVTFTAEVAGAGFKVSEFPTADDVHIVFDGIVVRYGTWDFYRKGSSLSLINGAELLLSWRMNLKGEDSVIFVGSGSTLKTSVAEPYHWLDISGNNAELIVEDGTIDTRSLYFGHEDGNGSPKGITVKGSKSKILVSGEAKVCGALGGVNPTIDFVVPTEGYDVPVFVKNGSSGNAFMAHEEGKPLVDVKVARNSPFFADRGVLDTQLIDWSYGGVRYAIDLQGINLMNPRRYPHSKYVLSPVDSETKSNLDLHLESFNGMALLLR